MDVTLIADRVQRYAHSLIYRVLAPFIVASGLTNVSLVLDSLAAHRTSGVHPRSLRLESTCSLYREG
jgi:hypothetical protein